MQIHDELKIPFNFSFFRYGIKKLVDVFAKIEGTKTVPGNKSEWMKRLVSALLK